MAVGDSLYNYLAKYWRSDLGMKLKDKLRPVKHFLVGKNGIYKAIDRVNELERAAGRAIGVVFDIGAAIGEAALPMLRAFPRATVYCFEPIPSRYEQLKKRTALFRHRVRYFNHALFDRNDSAEFAVHLNHPDSSSFLRGSGPAADTIIVKRRRLDDVVKELSVPRIHFMKIDVEGVEKEVLGGALATLKITDNVFIEISPLRKGFHNRDYIDVFEHLHSAGFSFEGVYGDYFFTKLLG